MQHYAVVSAAAAVAVIRGVIAAAAAVIRGVTEGPVVLTNARKLFLVVSNISASTTPHSSLNKRLLLLHVQPHCVRAP